MFMKIHFIGIGGIGVSALAQYYLALGYTVSGSDLATSEITNFLKKKGVAITLGNAEKNIQKDMDLVVYSPAVPSSNPELKRAKVLKIITKSYPGALGQLSKEYITIAIAGSHGKSTTTALVSLILIAAKLDPTVIIGTKLREFKNSNFRKGKSKYLVIEACEYDGSFLNYEPDIIVVTNVDKEHMDYFKTFSNTLRVFRSFIMKLPKNGFLVINKDDKNTSKLNIKNPRFNVQNYSKNQKEANKLQKILKIPGSHNVSNALAALAVARIIGVKDTISFRALSSYQGSWRRFEIIKNKPYTVISDYGHHPNEVSATVKAAKEKYINRKIWLFFQPHQYQRTYYLFEDFVKIFRSMGIDQTIITDIYDVAGREENRINQKINSKKLVEAINRKNVYYLPMKEAKTFIKKNIKPKDVLLVMGAGDIYKLNKKF